MAEIYNWVDNCCASGVALCNTDILNECLMHLKYENNGGGLELCDIGTALYVDETKGKRRILNGSIVDINVSTQAWLNRLLEIKNTNPDYFTDKETWQSEATLNVDGCVYKFVLNYDDEGVNITSVRLPKYPDYVEVTAGSSATTAPVAGFVKSLIGGGTILLPNANLNPNWDGSYALTSNGKYRHCDLYAQDGSGNVTVRGIGDGSVYYVDAQADLSGVALSTTKLKLYYFIQIATGSETKNNIVSDIELNNPYVLFTSHYVEAPLYNLSWLKSDGEYKPKATYVKAYEALVVENNSSIAVGTTVDLPSGTKYTKRGLSVKLSSATDITDYNFVINTTDEKFRLPLKNGMEGIFASGVKGDGKTLGCIGKDGTKSVNVGLTQGLSAIYFPSDTYNKPYGTYSSQTGSAISGGYSVGLTTDPTKSGIVVDTTVPSGWNLYYYVGETVQNSNLIDAGRIAEELGNKVSISNTQWATNACTPDYTAGIALTSATLQGFVAPSDGVITGAINWDSATEYLKVNGYNVLAGNKETSSVYIGLAKGDKLSYTSTTVEVTFTRLYFYPLKGG